MTPGKAWNARSQSLTGVLMRVVLRETTPAEVRTLAGPSIFSSPLEKFWGQNF
ncbi:hypothetical protein SH139x_003247 [Planctomycetaceae bacterium SH139]